MLSCATLGFVFALFNLGGSEIALVVGLVVIMFVAKQLPTLGKGLGEGLRQFWNATRNVGEELDQQAHDAGASVSGIYGKAAAQALTPDNHVAELYDPAAFHKRRTTWHSRLSRLISALRKGWRNFRKSVRTSIFKTMY